MKIKNVKINGFGKLENKELNFKNNINLVYGSNEAGKTTLLKFISSIFYGVSKNKNGKEVSDFEKYEPWDAKEFSGKIKYNLDNGECFEVFRDFSKKNPKIYNNNGEEISKQFSIDKNKGNQFFYEQTKIDEPLFLNTTLVEQQNVVLDEKGQNLLVQKITNLLATGEDNVSFNRAIDKLNKKMIEEIGTERTIGRPLNVANEKINVLNNEKNNFDDNNEQRIYIENEIKKLETNIKEKTINLKIIKDIRNKREEIIIEEEKIKINTQLNEENYKKINQYEEQIKAKKDDIKGKKNVISTYILIGLIVVNILIAVLNFNKIINYVGIGITTIYLIANLIIYLEKMKKNKDDDKKNKKIEYEIEILKENAKKVEQEIEKIEAQLNDIKESNNKTIIEEFKEKIGNEEIKILLNQQMSNEEIEELEEELNKMRFKVHTLEREKSTILEKIDKEAQIEEALEGTKEVKEDLLSLRNSIDIAKEILEDAYLEMKSNFTPKFTEELSKIVGKISEEKYRKCKFTDEEGLIVELENGEYKKCNDLSIGTIDQLYLALRLSAMLEVGTEKMPIILDEAFAFYDSNRMKNILRYLNEYYKDNQIIIFSCSNREREILNNLNIEYNFIEI